MPHYRWSPSYEVPKGKETIHVDINDVSCQECPVSFVTARSRWIIRLAIENEMHHKAAGASMFGPDTLEWPQWWCDAVALVQSESTSATNACNEAR